LFEGSNLESQVQGPNFTRKIFDLKQTLKKLIDSRSIKQKNPQHRKNYQRSQDSNSRQQVNTVTQKQNVSSLTSQSRERHQSTEIHPSRSPHVCAKVSVNR
jgi:hypothetical protein